jgi:ubiquinone/menaquinone biosynthesis C-methylase UbiE
VADLDNIRDFWDSRANLGEIAGTNDFMLTRIEQEFIVDMVPNNSRVLDIGCGNALSLIKLAQEKGCTGVGIDFSQGMIETSQRHVVSHGLGDKISLHQAAIPPIPEEFGLFDVALSNRCLINLTSTEDQRDAVQGVARILRPGGVYIMVECSVQGADATNQLRRSLGLEPLEVPWHNLFMSETDVESWQSSSFAIEQFLHISSTYHFLSRVVYAKFAQIQGEPLVYDSLINTIALDLPQQIGDFGPVKAWIWRKS